MKPLAAWMRERSFSLRELARLTRKHDPRGNSKGLSAPYLSGVERGIESPSLDAIEMIAGALGVEMADVAEVRLAWAREWLDPTVGGWERALESLLIFEAAMRDADLPG